MPQYSENPHRWGEIIGENIRELRLTKGWTQGYLAERITWTGWPISASRVSRLENCARNPRYGGDSVHVKLTVDKLMMVADVLEVHFTRLLQDGDPS